MKSDFEVDCNRDTGICTARLKVGVWKTYAIGHDLVGRAMGSRIAGRDYLGFGMLAEIAAVSKKRKTVDFVVSTNAPDRMGDIIEQSGILLKNYRRNPVHLYAHDSRGLPIGKALKTVVSGDKLLQRIEYTPVTGFDLPQAVFELVEADVLRGISIGFIPIEFSFIEGGAGRLFTRIELLETSTVPIPANPEALVTGKTFAADNLGLSGVPQVELEIADRRELDPAEEVLAAIDKDDEVKGIDTIFEDMIRMIEEMPSSGN